jgi:microcystin degradation protein MlrC
MRLAIAGLMHESNTFASSPANRQRFVEGSLARGEAVLPIWRDAHHEFGGFIEGASKYGYDLVPSVMAWATPSGPVTDDVLDEVVDQIITACRATHIDGLLLALHGAMVTAKHPNADTEVVRRLRAALGPELPISVSLDFHANGDPMMTEYVQSIVGYQTYPHVDQRQRGLLAAEILMRTLDGEIKPVTYIAKRPMIANILGQATEREPMRTLMAKAREAEKKLGMVSVNVMGGFYYADVPNMGPSIIAVGDANSQQVKEIAEQLADEMWAVRQELFVPCASPYQAVHVASTAEKQPVILVDLGDNIGGGSAGDGTVLLTQMLKQQVQGGIVAMYAPQAVQECIRLGVGGQFVGTIGGAVDRLHGDPLPITGTVQSIHDGKWLETEARHGGRRHNDQGPTVVLTVNGPNTLVLNSLQTPPFSLGQFTSLGLDPSQASMIVVKAAVAYKAAYEPIAGSIIHVDTPGVTAVNPAHFEYRHIPRPMFPLD